MNAVDLIKIQEQILRNDVMLLYYVTHLNTHVFLENITGLKNKCKELINRVGMLEQEIVNIRYNIGENSEGDAS